jgi:hypothetical protein
MFRLRRGEGNALLCKRGPVQWAECEVECDEQKESARSLDDVPRPRTLGRMEELASHKSQ